MDNKHEKSEMLDKKVARTFRMMCNCHPGLRYVQRSAGVGAGERQ
jgi:hypothetical protein